MLQNADQQQHLKSGKDAPCMLSHTQMHSSDSSSSSCNVTLSLSTFISIAVNFSFPATNLLRQVSQNTLRQLLASLKVSHENGFHLGLQLSGALASGAGEGDLDGDFVERKSVSHLPCVQGVVERIGCFDLL